MQNIKMNWTFLVPLLELPFPIYNVLRMALEDKSDERSKQINFMEQLVSRHGFFNDNINDQKIVVKISNHDFARRLKVVIPSFFRETVSIVEVFLKNGNDTCFLLQWKWRADEGTNFLYWNPVQSPDGWSWKQCNGDYYQARAAFMDKFQSIINCL